MNTAIKAGVLHNDALQVFSMAAQVLQEVQEGKYIHKSELASLQQENEKRIQELQNTIDSQHREICSQQLSEQCLRNQLQLYKKDLTDVTAKAYKYMMIYEKLESATGKDIKKIKIFVSDDKEFKKWVNDKIFYLAGKRKEITVNTRRYVWNELCKYYRKIERNRLADEIEKDINDRKVRITSLCKPGLLYLAYNASEIKYDYINILYDL